MWQQQNHWRIILGMKITAILLLTAFFLAPAQAEVYKYLDEQGNVVFSDRQNPSGEDEVVDISPPNTIPSTRGTRPTVKMAPPQSKASSKPQDLYSSLSIVHPVHDSSVRANDGNLTVKIESEPPLDAGAGDLLKLYLDGQPAAQGMSAHIPLENLDRGEHSLEVQIIDVDGQVLKTSPSIKFYIQRHSVLFKK